MSTPPKKNLLGQTSSGKRKANVPSKPQSVSVPGKKKTKVTALGSRPGTVSPETNYTKDNPRQAAIKGGQKYGLPYESRAYKSGAEPADYAKKKDSYKKPVTKKATSPASSEKKSEESTASKREAMKPIKGISNIGGALTRTLPSDSISAVKKPSVKGVDTSKKTYSAKDQKIAAVMQKGKKKDGTMKASAQRKIQRIRKSK